MYSRDTVAAAEALRRDGWSLREIARHLGVSLSRVSEWVRHIPAAERRAAPDDASAAVALPVWASGRVRVCPRCRRLLPDELFSRMGHGRQGWCKSCFQGYHRDRTGVARARTNERIEVARAYVLAYRSSHGCADCRESDPAVLEFDHVQEKRDMVSVLVNRGAPIARIAEEIERCQVVCVNCHRRRTARRSGSRRLGDDFGARATRPLRERNLRFLFARLTESGCVDCGERDLVVLDFDHIDGKTAAVSRLAHREASIATLEQEIARCVVRCASCHRRRTAGALGYYTYLAAAPPN